MANLRVVFEVFKGLTPEHMREGKVKPVLKHVGTHIIFGINVDGKFIHKAILLVGGHKTSPPPYIAYSIFLTRESVRLAFLIAGMNYLYMCACNIGNPYLNYPCQ